MAIFNKILKGRKSREEKAEKVEQSKASRKILAEKEISGVAFDKTILYSPRITEKSNDAIQKNAYTFVVNTLANKIQIKRAVEDKFNVKVVSVRTVSLPRKVRRRGRQVGYKSGIKKAIVTLKEGDTIELS